MKNVIILLTILLGSCHQVSSVINSDKSDTIKILPIVYKDSLITSTKRADFEVTYFDFNQLPNPLKDSVTHFFNQVISSENKSIQEEGKDFVNSILKDSFSSNYAINIDFLRETENKDYFILNKNEYSYLGGAHPNSTFQYIMFNKHTGAIASLNNFLKMEKWNDFLKLNESYFKQSRGVADSTKFNHIEGLIIGDTNSSLPFASTWYFDHLGLHVLYNQYEVLCYAAGTTEYLIPIKDLKNFLK